MEINNARFELVFPQFFVKKGAFVSDSGGVKCQKNKEVGTNLTVFLTIRLKDCLYIFPNGEISYLNRCHQSYCSQRLNHCCAFKVAENQ